MTSPGAAVIVTAIASLASLMIVVMIMNSLVEGSMDIRDVQTNEHADDVVVVSRLPETATDHQINLNGFWAKSVVTVSFFSAGMPQQQFEEVFESLRGSLKVTQEAKSSNINTRVHTVWPDLLLSISAQSKNVPLLQIVEPSSDAADIKVFLEANRHPENKLGSAKIARDKATFEIMSGEVHVYSAYDLYKKGYVGPVFKHELGHALGLGHATSETSIMHTPLIIVDNTVFAGIKNCEVGAASSLYVDRVVKEITCPVPSSP